MAIIFKSSFNCNYLECESNLHAPDKTIDIIITNSDQQETCVFLDVNTAIHLRKHLGREIAKLKEVNNGGR